MEIPLKYDHEVSEDIHKPYSIIAKVYDWIPSGFNVLDVGCHTGQFGAVLKRKGCRVTGMEINPAAAEKAKRHLDRVSIADVEAPESFLELRDKYDVILFLDSLEHCRNPGAVLERAKAVLTAGGFVLASIPNIANWSIRINLLLGRFEYEEVGIMDVTHLRFYTIVSAKRLFADSGYRIEGMDHRYRLPIFRERKVIGGKIVKFFGARFPGLFSYQILVRAKPC